MTVRRLSAGVLVAAACLAGASCDSPSEPSPICTITISPAALTFGDEGGTGAATVAAPAGCAWSVTGVPAWITITGGASGSGPGTVAYSVASNPGTVPRSGTLMIGDQPHAVTQQGRSATVCSYELSPPAVDIRKDNATGTFAISTPAGCAWTATSNASWLVVSSGSQGTGNGSVGYIVAANSAVAERTAAVTVADQTFEVRQAGDVDACRYGVAPVILTPCMPAGSLIAMVTTQPSCPWTATSDASWLTIPSGASGTGSGEIAIQILENYAAPREGVVMVRWPAPTAGQNIRVAQAGCLYGVTPGTFSIPSGGGTEAFNLVQQSDPVSCGGATQDRCIWTARTNVSWITISGSMPRAGDDRVTFTVAANTGTSARVGTIVVGDTAIVITQAGR